MTNLTNTIPPQLDVETETRYFNVALTPVNIIKAILYNTDVELDTTALRIKDNTKIKDFYTMGNTIYEQLVESCQMFHFKFSVHYEILGETYSIILLDDLGNR